MAQGSSKSGAAAKTKLAKKRKSAGSQKRQLGKNKTLRGKGTRDLKPRHASSTSAASAIVATTKAINQKNEAAIAAKAVAVGTKFFLSDVKAKGEREMNKQLRARHKKEKAAAANNGGAVDRVKAQLRKLGKNV